MAMNVGEADDEIIGTINTTPLVDVMLVLLIVFMITIPVMQHAVKVDLPQASSQRNDVKPESINLSIAFLSAIAPVGTNLISSVNTSSWAIVGTTVFTLSILAIDVTKLRSKHTVLAVSLSAVGFSIANASRHETKYQLLLIFMFVSIYKYPNKLRPTLTKKTLKFGAITIFFIYFCLVIVFLFISNMYFRL